MSFGGPPGARSAPGEPAERTDGCARPSPMHDEVVELLRALVAIDSVNPALTAGGAGEAQIAAHVAAWARSAGLDAELLEATPGRPSALVRARGRGGGRTLLLCGHVDTVGVAGMRDPFTPRIAAGRLAGRGAYDMKGGVAAALVACRAAAALELAGDVVVAAVADEEHASLGVGEALAALGPTVDAAIVTEPTELELAVAHKGFAWARIEVRGRAAHGSRPELGVDAIVKAGPILTALGALDAQLARRPRHPLLGRASVHAATIAGGAELSGIPARCVLELERRTLPGETAAFVEAELDALLARCRAADEQLDATRATLLVREPFEIDARAPIAALVREQAATVLGQPPPIGGVSFWADAALIAAAGIPTVLFGPAGAGAHAADEWVDVDSVAAVARTLLGVAARFCA